MGRILVPYLNKLIGAAPNITISYCVVQTILESEVNDSIEINEEICIYFMRKA